MSKNNKKNSQKPKQTNITHSRGYSWVACRIGRESRRSDRRGQLLDTCVYASLRGRSFEFVYFICNLHKTEKTEIICIAKSEGERKKGLERVRERGKSICNRSVSAVTSVKASQVF